MSLIQNVLVGLTKSYAQPAQAAQQIALAYESYARMAMSAGHVVLLTGAERPLFEQTILSAIASPQIRNPAVWAAAWFNAVLTFWSAPPLNFLGPAPGIVTVPPLPTIQAAVAAATAAPQPGEAWAAATANAVNAGVMGVVMVLHTPPPPTPPFLSPVI